MLVLLIGAYGQLGTEFRRFFEKNGIDYIPVSRNRREDKTVVLDISDISKLKEVVIEYKPNLVINCSAYNNVDRAEYEDYHSAWLINTYGVMGLSLICNESKIPVIHYSTDYVFDGGKRKPYVEDDKTIPVNRYGITKLGGEEFLRFTCERYICLRVSWVFGEGGETNFIRKLLKWAQGGSVKVSVDEVSSPTYTETIVNVSWKLFENSVFGLYHLSSEGECSRYEYAKFVLDTIGWKGEIIETTQSYFNLPAKRPSYSKLDSSRVKSLLGIEIPSWKEVVYRYLREEYRL